MNKKELVGVILIVGVLVVVGFFWSVGNTGFNEEIEEGIECVKVRTTCCPCSMGGVEKCVLASEIDKYSNLSKCPKNFICPTVYSCEIESCEYIDGECIAR